MRRNEVLSLKVGDIDFEKRMIIPKRSPSRTKKTWITFYNDEAEEVLKKYLGSFQSLDKEENLFPVSEHYFRRRYKDFEEETEIKMLLKF